VMTSSDLACGTDRCHDAFQIINEGNTYGPDDVIINIQGDEPLIDPEQINLVASCFKSDEVKIATLIKKLDNVEDLQSPNVMKVVCDDQKRAMYFSRSPIPYFRGLDQKQWIKKHTYFHHIGIYAYRVSVLAQLRILPQSTLEKAEALEQLRWLQNGYSIYVEQTDYQGHAVDVPGDVEKIIKLLNESKN
jgi:3-deoxy-manno-octulosonate cytidylyltransferase (CMP-KDO synthetase)